MVIVVGIASDVLIQFVSVLVMGVGWVKVVVSGVVLCVSLLCCGPSQVVDRLGCLPCCEPACIAVAWVGPPRPIKLRACEKMAANRMKINGCFVLGVLVDFGMGGIGRMIVIGIVVVVDVVLIGELRVMIVVVGL